MLFNKKIDESPMEPPHRAPPARPSAEPAAAPQSMRAPQNSSPTQSVIDAWLTITGNLESQGDIRIEGQISGNIRCANLVIGRDAMVCGDIIAEEAVVRGKIKGTIRANRVVLQETACVESSIYHKVLSVDEGASFDGHSFHRTQPHLEDEATTRIVKSGREGAAVETFERAKGAAAGSSLHAVEA
jgi:cytoskeletal protein CcmA (bactofilin family)